MGNRKPAYLWTSIALAVLLFVEIVSFLVKAHRFFFTSIDSAVYAEEMVWGVNSDGGNTAIFRVSADTGIGDYLLVPFIEDKRIVTISDPFVYDGQVYFRKTMYGADGRHTEKLVYWDTKRNKLKEVKIPLSLFSSVLGWIESEGFKNAGDGKGYSVLEVDPPEDSDLRENGNVQLCVLGRGQERLLDCLTRESGVLVRRIFIAFIVAVLFFAILMIVCSLAFYYHFYPGLQFRIGLMILIMMGGLLVFCGNRLGRDMYAYACNHALYYCADSAHVRSFAVNMDYLESLVTGEEDFTAKHMADIWKYDLDDGSRVKAQYKAGHSEEEDSDSFRAWELYDDYVITEENCLVIKKDDDFQIFYDSLVQDNSWLMGYYPALRKHIEMAFSKEEPQSLVTVTGNQRYAMTFVPVWMDSGTMVLVGTRVQLNHILIRFFLLHARTFRILIFLGICSLILILLGITWALRPIDSLKRAIREIAAGNFKARTRCIGINELHCMARLFNEMADRLETQSEGTDSYRLFYDAFLPASLIRSLSGRSVSGALRPGAVYRTNTCCLVVDVRGNDSSDEERNRLLLTAIRASEGHSIHLVRSDEKQIKLLCTDSPVEALRAVTNLQQNLSASGKHFAWSGMAFGPERLCVIGNERRKNAVVRDMNEAEILSEIARELEIPVILTEKIFLDAMRNTAKLHFRCLGRIGREDYEPDAPLYELLDANTAAKKAIRKYTRSVFQEGVNAYASGDYFKARNDMIKALEQDPEDLAARCYILNCDRKEPRPVCQAMKQDK
ncbi:MAG: HAMP domain-containing protein [Lachnospiraceae bacterium]|nr:HAMP domain-containing protein [Lachnospiraceae bacterium]